MRLKGRTALITGGNSGIGLATARLFVAEGARVAITGRNEATLAEAAQALGPQAIVVAADLATEGGAEQAVAEAVRHFGALDIVFANAGIAGPSPVGATDAAAFNAILQTNVTAVFLTVQAAAPYLSATASVILNGSVHATLGVPGWSAYAASKAAAHAMSRVLASELGVRGTRVNIVVPGATRTPIWSGLAPDAEALTALETRLSRSIPLGHLGEADDIAHAALYLASDEARHVHGAEIVVDGGHTGAPAGAPAYR